MANEEHCFTLNSFFNTSGYVNKINEVAAGIAIHAKIAFQEAASSNQLTIESATELADGKISWWGSKVTQRDWPGASTSDWRKAHFASRGVYYCTSGYLDSTIRSV
jgi:hypothetical protein